MTNIIGFGDRSRHQEDSVIQEALNIMESRYRQGSDARQVFTSPELVRNYLSLKMADYEREVFAVLLLDSQHRLIECDELFQGTIDTASVYPREVVKLTLKYNAAAVILAHNHPSGLSEPSESDRRVTARLVNALATIDVPVLDHLVVGKNEVASFAERGLL